MAKTRKLVVDILADASRFASEVTKADGYTKRLKGSMKALGSSMAIGVGAAGAAAFAFGKSALDAAIDAEKAQKAVEATIKSTGGAANVTAKDIDKFASKMQMKTGIDDEAIKKSQALLLGFKSVRNESGKGNKIFNRASVAMLDLGAKLGSTDSAAKALGRALTDPVNGLKGLKGAGVVLTDSQKETIKNLVETGDLLGAQKIVLDEVTGATGGFAESQVTAGDKAKLAFGEIQEKIGAGLLPVAEKLGTWVTDTFIPGIERFWKEHGPKIIDVFEKFKKALKKIGETLGPVVLEGLKALGKFIKDNKDAIATGIGVIAGALLVYTGAVTAAGIASGISAIGFGILEAVTSPIWGTILLTSAAFLGLIAALGATGDLFPVIIDSAKSWFEIIKKIPDLFRGIWREIIPIVNGMIGLFEGLVNSIIDAVNRIIYAINLVKPGKDLAEIGHVTLGRFQQTGITDTRETFQSGGVVRMAEGGLVTRATRAIVGEAGPEAVIPLEQLGFGQPAQTTTVTINVNASPLSSPSDVGAAVVDALQAWSRRNGRLPSTLVM